MPQSFVSVRSSAIAALILAPLLTLSVAGCDRQSGVTAQPKENPATVEKGYGPKLDRSASGSSLPQAILTDPDGRTLDSATLKGRPVLVNLWATWCAPCKREMPTLDALAQEYEGNLKVLTVSQDLTGAEAVSPYFAKSGFAMLEPWLDPKADFAGHYGQNIALPMTILYDRSGREIWRYSGDRDWTDEASRALLHEGTGLTL